MESFYQLVSSRQSDRAYDINRPVELEKIGRIIEAARLAPSACNSQPWHFIVVNNPSECHKVAEALISLGMNKFAQQAPCFIAVVQESPNFTARLGGWIKNKHFPLIDCGVAVSYITLAATAEGLGSCIMGWFDEKRLKRLLGIPKNKRVLMVVSLGYSTQPTREKQRKPLCEITSQSQYDEPFIFKESENA